MFYVHVFSEQKSSQDGSRTPSATVPGKSPGEGCQAEKDAGSVSFFCFEGELQWTTNSGKQQARQRQDGSRWAQVLLRRLQVSLNINNRV